MSLRNMAVAVGGSLGKKVPKSRRQEAGPGIQVTDAEGKREGGAQRSEELRLRAVRYWGLGSWGGSSS